MSKLIRFTLQKTDQDGFVCIDKETKVQCTFIKGRFSATREFSTGKNTSIDPVSIADSMYGINEWLLANHYDIMISINHRKRIGDDIKRLRLGKKLRQLDLATKAGINQAHISRIEKGTNSVSFDTLQRIAEVLDCNISLMPIDDEL